MNLETGAAAFHAIANQSPFNLQTPPPSLGTHKVALTVETASTGAPTRAGRGTLRIKRDGSATLTERLGGRTPFASGSALIAGTGTGSVLPIFDALYRAGAGSVSEQLEFDAAAISTATGNLHVAKPARVRPANSGFTILYEAATVTR